MKSVMVIHSSRVKRTDAVILAAGMALFAVITGLQFSGGWYSSDFLYRWQTDAMLSGTFALQPMPYHQRADWAWGAGSQHVWGLGVPLVRLPFELAARLLGAGGFPDRLVLVVVFGAVLATVLRALDAEADEDRAAIAVVLLFLPAFTTLCRTRFAVYEEPVAYGYLCAVLMLALLLRLERTGGPRVLASIAALCGAAVFFRPTLAFYAAITLALALRTAMRHRIGLRALAASGALFAAALGAVLLTNWLRFRDALEFGQRLNVSRYTLDQFAKNFGYPFAGEPIGRAVRELAGALFFVDRGNGNDFYGSALYAWQSPTVRFREFYFATFDATALALLVGSWALAAWTARRGRIDPRRRRLATTCALWSAAAFALQFLFYLRMPSMTSRYAVDFAAAVAAGLAGAIFAAGAFVDRRIVAAAVAAWTLVASSRAWIDPTHAARPLLTADQVARLSVRPTPTGPPIPSAYRCGDDLSSTAIPFNGIGWDARGDCSVDVSTTLYMTQPRCVALTVAGETQSIRVKYGVTFLIRAAERLVAAADTSDVTFCPPAGFRPNPTGVAIVYVGWVDPRDLAASTRPPDRLLSIKSVDFGPVYR